MLGDLKIGGDHMSVATVTSKGQITIPLDVRKELGLETAASWNSFRMERERIG